MIVQQYDMVKNNIILSICVDMKHNTMVLETKNEERRERVSIKFTGLFAHQFDFVARYNILAEIRETPVKEYILRDWKKIDENLKVGFPILSADIVCASDLGTYITNGGWHVYDVVASAGLGGYVIAKKLEISVVEE